MIWITDLLCSQYQGVHNRLQKTNQKINQLKCKDCLRGLLNYLIKYKSRLTSASLLRLCEHIFEAFPPVFINSYFLKIMLVLQNEKWNNLRALKRTWNISLSCLVPVLYRCFLPLVYELIKDWSQLFKNKAHKWNSCSKITLQGDEMEKADKGERRIERRE